LTELELIFESTGGTDSKGCTKGEAPEHIDFNHSDYRWLFMFSRFYLVLLVSWGAV